MYKGVIVIFNKKDTILANTINLNVFFNYKIKICLVNNGDNIHIEKQLNKLKGVTHSNVSILSLRKEKKIQDAVKLGVRFLSNLDKFSFILYTTPKNLYCLDITNILLKNLDKNIAFKKKDRLLLRNVYSISDFS